jgi:hypothetical protein
LRLGNAAVLGCLFRQDHARLITRCEPVHHQFHGASLLLSYSLETGKNSQLIIEDAITIQPTLAVNTETDHSL